MTAFKIKKVCETKCLWFDQIGVYLFLFFQCTLYAYRCVCLSVTPHTQCRLKLLKQERIKDYLLMEEEFIRNQEQMKPLEEKQEVSSCYTCTSLAFVQYIWVKCRYNNPLSFFSSTIQLIELWSYYRTDKIFTSPTIFLLQYS